MVIATIYDYEQYNKVTVEAADNAHIEMALQAAEDDLEREVGRIFFNDDPTGRAGRDWLKLASWRAREYVNVLAPDAAAALASPYQSETIGKYSYTLKTPDQAVGQVSMYASILEFYAGSLKTATIDYGRRGLERDEYSG